MLITGCESGGFGQEKIGFVLGLFWVCFGFDWLCIGFVLALIGFELALFSGTAKMSFLS